MVVCWEWLLWILDSFFPWIIMFSYFAWPLFLRIWHAWRSSWWTCHKYWKWTHLNDACAHESLTCLLLCKMWHSSNPHLMMLLMIPFLTMGLSFQWCWHIFLLIHTCANNQLVILLIIIRTSCYQDVGFGTLFYHVIKRVLWCYLAKDSFIYACT